MDKLFVIGTNFKHTGFVDLSGWTLPTAFRGFALQELKRSYHIDEAVYLSTCNRSELVLWTREGFSARRVMRVWREWAARAGGQLLSPKSDLRVLQGDAAVRYLFDVAASLDSLVVGETEILRQLRLAHSYAQQNEFSGRNLRRVIERALKTGKKVRHQTSLASLSTSVVSVAIKEIRRRLAGRKIERALVIGAGETGGAVARSLRSLGVKFLAVANRTVERAQALAAEIDAIPFSLDDVPSLAEGCEVIVSAAAVPYTIVEASMLNQNRSTLLVDLAIPSNIDRACGELRNATLIGLPELEAIAAANKPLLERELENADQIVIDGMTRLAGDFKMATMSPLIKQTRKALVEVARDEVDEISALLNEELGGLDEQIDARLRRRLDKMVKRLLHVSTEQFKDHARSRLKNES